MKWISLQPLIGGMSIGAEQAFGCPPSMILNYDGVLNTFAYLHYMNDIRKLNIPFYEFDGDIYSGQTSFKKNASPDFNDIDVVSAVPICSGLSFANAVTDKTKENAWGSDAKQNNNMLNCCKFSLEHIKPKVYIFENAPALSTNGGKGIRDKLNSIASKNGYAVTYIKTDTYLHYNPQHRSRSFCIMWKDKAPQLRYVHEQYDKTLNDFLSQIPTDSKYQDIVFFKNFQNNGFIEYMHQRYGDNFWDIWAQSKLVSVIGHICKNKDFDFACQFMNESEKHQVRHAQKKFEAGKNFFDNTPLWYGETRINTVFGRTITRYIHPSKTRGYNMREFLTFMGMPYDFEYPGLEKKASWIGQNVPAHTAYDWHKQIKEFLEGKLSLINDKVSVFNNLNLKTDFKFGAI